MPSVTHWQSLSAVIPLLPVWQHLADLAGGTLVYDYSEPSSATSRNEHKSQIAIIQARSKVL
jgi:hypothetical protein